jgi:hypothetical protein
VRCVLRTAAQPPRLASCLPHSRFERPMRSHLAASRSSSSTRRSCSDARARARCRRGAAVGQRRRDSRTRPPNSARRRPICASAEAPAGRYGLSAARVTMSRPPGCCVAVTGASPDGGSSRRTLRAALWPCAKVGVLARAARGRGCAAAGEFARWISILHACSVSSVQHAAAAPGSRDSCRAQAAHRRLRQSRPMTRHALPMSSLAGARASSQTVLLAAETLLAGETLHVGDHVARTAAPP